MFKRIRRIIQWAVLVAFLVLGVSFAVANRAHVSVSLFPLPYEMELPLFLLLMCALLLGMLLSGFTMNVMHLRLRRQLRAERERKDALENELKAHHAHKQQHTALSLQGFTQ